MTKNNRIKHLFNSIGKTTIFSVAVNLLWVYLLYEACRLIFLWLNWTTLGESMSWSVFLSALEGGWRFDSSAIFYTNSLYILLALLPLHIKEGRKGYQAVMKWIYVVINSFCLLINLADSVFFEFRGQRTTMAIFREFGNESNIGSIIGVELLNHWYLIPIFALMVFALIKLYRKPSGAPQKPLWRYYVRRVAILAVTALITVSAMRGNVFFLSATRPISVNFAFRFVDKPVEAGLVLNTPFSLIRTVGQIVMSTPQYYTQEHLDKIYTPIHTPSPQTETQKKNIVILMVESFAQEFIGGLNKELDNGTYKGYTPHTDTMLDSCMYFETMLCNTFFSIDALPAVTASIPRFERPFVVSPHSLNHINSIASELKNIGYTSAFFHGADNESLGFSAFTRQAGFDRYYGMNEFNADSRFGGSAEFDGKWGIWDEPFLQYFCATISEIPQPFLATVFTLSSHHPFRIPDKYVDTFPDEGIFPMHKCIRYTDYSIHQFFESARKQPWFNNTIFILTADHSSSKRTHAEYKTTVGDYRVPILIYDPSGHLPRGQQKGIAQQIDIMPTVLNYVGYDRPYVAFGKDLLNTPAEESWAFAANSIPTYFKGDYVMTFDGTNVVSLFNFREDPLEQNNLAGSGLDIETEMLREVKAIVQSYLTRMNSDQLTVK